MPEPLRVVGVGADALAAHGARAVERADEGARASSMPAPRSPPLRQLGVGGDRHLAAALERAEQRALGAHGQRGRPVVERRPSALTPRVVGARLDGERALPDGRQHLVEVEGEAGHLGAAEPAEPGGREDRAGHALVLQLAQARLDVAADVDHVEVGAQRQQLRAAPQARACRRARPAARRRASSARRPTRGPRAAPGWARTRRARPRAR